MTCSGEALQFSLTLQDEALPSPAAPHFFPALSFQSCQASASASGEPLATQCLLTCPPRSLPARTRPWGPREGFGGHKQQLNARPAEAPWVGRDEGFPGGRGDGLQQSARRLLSPHYTAPSGRLRRAPGAGMAGLGRGKGVAGRLTYTRSYLRTAASTNAGGKK